MTFRLRPAGWSRPILCLLAGVLVAAQAAAVSAKLATNQSSGVAPLAVFFDARGTTESGLSSTDAFLDLAYEWDFGDTACRSKALVWAYSGKSRCQDVGPLAGHVYETPGTYTAKLIVRGQGGTSTRTVTINVGDPNQVFAGTNTICVSRNGDFKDPNGVCNNARKVTSGASFESIRSAYLASGRRLLFRRGDSWTNGGNYKYSGSGPAIIGAYGTGPKPVIQQGSTTMQSFTRGASGLRIMYIEVAGNDDPKSGTAFYAGASGQVKNLLIFRVDVKNVAKPFMFSVNGGPTPGSANMNNGVAIVASTSLSRPSDSGNNDFFGGAERLLFMGNNVGDADGIEHTVRFQFLRGGVVSHNSLGRKVPSNKHLVKMHNIFDGSPCTQEVMLADNRLAGGGSANLVELGPQNGSSINECVRLVRVERNHLSFGGTTGYRQILVRGGENLIANNILDLSGANPKVRPRGIWVNNRDPAQVQRPLNNRIYNNTCYRSDAGPGAVCVRLDGSATNTKVYNNLIYAPLASPKALDDAGSNTVAAHNVVASSNPFIATHPTIARDFQVTAGVVAVVDAGTAVQTRGEDFSGLALSRVVNKIDVGAWERGTASSGSASSGPPAAPVLLP